jgi:PAS domain S-box-containing protein
MADSITELKVLIAEESIDDTESLLSELERAGFTAAYERVSTRVELDTALARCAWDVILADIDLPGLSASEILHCVKDKELDIPLVVVSDAAHEEVAVSAMYAGARDYVLIDKLIRLGAVIKRELSEAQERNRQRQADENLLQRASELTVLHAVSRVAIESPTESILIQQATEIIGRLLFPDQLGILLIDPELKVLLTHDSFRGLPNGYRAFQVPIDTGISGRVARTGQACYVPDVLQDPEYLDVGNGILSEMVVPIQIAQRVIGVIDAGVCRKEGFTDADLNLLSIIGVQLATAIDRLRGEASLRRQSQQLGTIYAMSQEFSRASLNPQQVYKAIHQAVAKLMPCEVFVITLYNEVTQRLDGVYLYDRGGHYPAFSIPEDHGISWQVLRSGCAIRYDVDHPDPQEPEKSVIFGPDDNDVASILMVPLRSANNVFGTLSTQSYLPRAYTENDLQILELLAGSAAVALQNSLLFEKVHRQALTFENMFDGVIVSDIDGAILEWNPAAERIFGYTCKEAIGQPVDFIHQPVNRTTLEKEIIATVDRDGRWMDRVNFIRKDGSEGILDVIVMPIRDENGKVVATLGVNRDITNQEQAEDDLRFSEARLSSIINSAIDAIIIVDCNGQINIFNPAAERMFGYSPADMLGQSLELLIPNRYRDASQADGTSLWTIENANSMVGILQEFSGMRSSGEEFPIELSLSKFEVNQQQYFTAIIRETTQRKRSEAQLARLAAVVEQAAESIVLTDSAGNITYVNPFFERVTGYRKEEVLKCNPRVLKSGVQPQAYYRELWNRISSGKSWTGKFVNRRKDGSHFHERATIFPIKNSDGEIINYAAVKQDISELVEHDREMEAFVAVSKALRAASTREEMIPIILEQGMDLLEGRGGLIITNDSMGNPIRVMGRGELLYMSSDRRLINSLIYRQVQGNNQAMIFQDPESLADLFSSYPDLIQKTIIAAPLIVQGKVNGVLMIGREAPYHNDDLRLLTVVADIAASATHRASLSEDTARHIVQLGEVSSAGREMIDMLSQGQIYNRLAASVQVIIPDLSGMLISIYDQSQSLIRCVYGMHDNKTLNPADFPALPLAQPGYGQQSEVIRTRQPQIVNRELIQKMDTPTELGEGDRPQSAVFVPMLVKDHVLGVLQVQSGKANRFSLRDAEMLSLLANTAGISIEKAGLYQGLEQKNIELSDAYDTTIEGWSRALELRDRETEGHTLRVTELTVELAKWFGFSDSQLVHLRRGALMHDIGKVGVPDSILHKPGPLNPDEWEIMRRHPMYAYNMLVPIEYLHPALDIPYCHHEKWDGTGYPRGQKEVEIPLPARIFAVIDVWDALTSDRPYRTAWPTPRALDYIKDQKGHHFDPQVVDAFLGMITDKIAPGKAG